jgi:uncharacterized Zn finger protein
MGWWSYRPYVPVSVRRAKAARAAQKLAKGGRKVAPVATNGRTIATTFWGKAWCDNLESYSDFENRLPRGRTYVRNGSVVDLQIEPGKIRALVSGSHLYRIEIEIGPLPAVKWKAIQSECRGQIGSLIELLQGRMSQRVMEIVTRRDSGLFPSPKEIKLGCSCPDWAEMCKHVAAVLYGVGNRLDHQPELLFQLRQVDHLELIAAATDSAALVKKSASKKKTIAGEDLAQVFGIELDAPAPVAKALRKASTAQPVVPPQRKQAKTKAKTGPAKRVARHGKTVSKKR